MEKYISQTLVKNFKQTELWQNKLKDDCKNGDVFLAIRNNKIELYYKGGLLFEYSNDCFKTHHKYASVIKESKGKYISESDLSQLRLISDFISGYDRIKENCSMYAKKEAKEISKITKNYSYLSDHNVIVLDIEASFEGLTNEKKQDRVDIIVFNKETAALKFVEAKLFSNQELKSTNEPRVINQLQNYNEQIANSGDMILKEYESHVNLLNTLFGLELPKPEKIEPKTELLIFSFDDDQRKGRVNDIVTSIQSKGFEVYSIGNAENLTINNLWR